MCILEKEITGTNIYESFSKKVFINISVFQSFLIVSREFPMHKREQTLRFTLFLFYIV